jgi:hypothetical protein
LLAAAAVLFAAGVVQHCLLRLQQHRLFWCIAAVASAALLADAAGAALCVRVQFCWCSIGGCCCRWCTIVCAGALLLMCCCALQRWTNRLEAAFETHHCMPAGMSVFFFPVIITRVFVEGGSSRPQQQWDLVAVAPWTDGEVQSISLVWYQAIASAKVYWEILRIAILKIKY